MWDSGVTLETPDKGQFRHIYGALEALDCLLSCWPTTPTEAPAHRLAVNACMASLNGEVSQRSRDAFLDAANEANMKIIAPADS